MISDILKLLNKGEKKRSLFLFLLILTGAMIETLGVASIMPFLAVLASPLLIQSQPILQKLYILGHFQDVRAFLMALGLAVFCVILFSNVIAALLHWALSRFTHMRTHTIALRLIHIYLGQPYEFFLRKDTSEMAHSVLTEVMHVVKNIIVTGTELLSRPVVSFFMVGLLVAINPRLSLYVGGGLAVVYIALYLSIHKRIAHLGLVRIESGAKKFREFKEIFSSFKEIRLAGAVEYFLRGFSKASQESARSFADYEIMSVLPKYCLEVLAFGGGIMILLYLLMKDQDLATILPTVGVYALAGQRLMPAMQSVFLSLSRIRYARGSLDNLVRQLSLPVCETQKRLEGASSIVFERQIVFKEVCFGYTLEDGTRQQIFEKLNLTLPKNKVIGFVGGTGAGKSTLMDILMGLLSLSSGNIYVDDKSLDFYDMQEWRKHISYVPQRMTLLNDSVINNVAFGVEPKKVDRTRVVECLKMAQIYDFVEREMPFGLETEVGENGVRLSGGQRQRLGLARALYRQADILILDEATSALDNVTEKAVIDSILQADDQKRTVLMIAHRLSTLKNCDTIHYLDQRQVIASGDYKTLMETSPEFYQLARAT